MGLLRPDESTSRLPRSDETQPLSCHLSETYKGYQPKVNPCGSNRGPYQGYQPYSLYELNVCEIKEK